MNEQIRELFKKAGGYTSTRNLVSNPVQVVEKHELWDDRIEKFAKLIAQDCITQIALYGISNFENDDIMWVVERSIDVIKERYGVEE